MDDDNAEHKKNIARSSAWSSSSVLQWMSIM